MAYTTINDPSAYFQAVLYTGTGSARSVTNNGNSDLQPDLVWAKNRNDAYNNVISDSNRGTTKTIVTDQTWAEITETHGLTSFDSNGFSIGGNAGGWNFSSAKTYVAWQWKANGGTNTSNTSGTITSTVQANTNAGISIVTYTGNATDGATIGHGLGVVPEIIITKTRDISNNWYVWSSLLSGDTYGLGLNSTAAEAVFTYGNYENVNSSTMGTNHGGSAITNVNGNNNYVAYCFASKQGYSKIGKYTGNNSFSGPFVYLGFKPAFMMIKRTDGASNWLIIDGTRDPANDSVSGSTGTNRLFPNLNNAEDTSEAYDLLSNGFKPRTTNALANTVNATYIYMAFAENPFVTSTGIPTTAR